MVLEPCLEDLDASLQRDQVCLAMQQVKANCRVLLLYVVLWIHVLLEVALQVFLYQLQGSFEVDYTMEGSVVDDMIAAYVTSASNDGKYAYSRYGDLWMQGAKTPCYKKLKGWRVYWHTRAKEGLNIHALQVDGNEQCFTFHPGGLYTILGGASSFPFDPGR
ncbi:hypothetical protein GOP47_0014022 [Adiantum capillus-veneris]|uniref:Uncharacterized protein n=1 Tax=Adiantum capillus-veneris TaxID=13818 RepID=A0A9D4ZGC2_ADICA|nr:hypothetical protein GOP47_0014022 [Adiantum capillus-veneris]